MFYLHRNQRKKDDNANYQLQSVTWKLAKYQKSQWYAKKRAACQFPDAAPVHLTPKHHSLQCVPAACQKKHRNDDKLGIVEEHQKRSRCHHQSEPRNRLKKGRQTDAKQGTRTQNNIIQIGF